MVADEEATGRSLAQKWSGQNHFGRDKAQGRWFRVINKLRGTQCLVFTVWINWMVEKRKKKIHFALINQIKLLFSIHGRCALFRIGGRIDLNDPIVSTRSAPTWSVLHATAKEGEGGGKV